MQLYMTVQVWLPELAACEATVTAPPPTAGAAEATFLREKKLFFF